MKLTAKLMLVFVLAVMALTAFNGYLAVQRESEFFEQEQRDSVLAMASKMENSLGPAWRDVGSEAVLQMIREMYAGFSQPPPRWVWFSDPAGRERPTRLPEEKLRAIVRGEVISVMSRDADGGGYLITYYPIRAGGGRVGGLEFSQPLSRLDQRTRSTIRTTLFQIAAMGLAGGLLAILAGVRMVGRPLNQLMAKTRQVGDGDFSKPLDLPGHDELSQLAEALNRMSEQLAAQQRRIREETSSRIAAIEQLRHADRLKTVGRLAAGIAHELGTPLNVVSGRAGLIASGKLSESEIRESAATIRAESDKITAIIRKLLDFARRSAPHRTTVDLRNVVAETIHLVQTLAEKQGVSIRTARLDQPAVSHADVGQIQQVLTNILVNAIQSMPGGGEVLVSLRRERTRPPGQPDAADRDCVRIDVQDEGHGIASEDLEQVFEPFFTNKDVGEGTGLGLSIAYGIVQEHGGWIDVASRLGEGSRFSIYLPRELETCRTPS